jgi:hypothetical protein
LGDSVNFFDLVVVRLVTIVDADRGTVVVVDVDVALSSLSLGGRFGFLFLNPKNNNIQIED